MRAVGVIVAIAAAAAAVACVQGAFSARRPRDLGFALAASLLVLALVGGIVIALAPDAL